MGFLEAEGRRVGAPLNILIKHHHSEHHHDLLICAHLMCPGPILRWLPGTQPPGPPDRHNLKLSTMPVMMMLNDGDQVLEVG